MGKIVKLPKADPEAGLTKKLVRDHAQELYKLAPESVRHDLVAAFVDGYRFLYNRIKDANSVFDIGEE